MPYGRITLIDAKHSIFTFYHPKTIFTNERMIKLFPPHPPYMGGPPMPPQTGPVQIMSRFLPGVFNSGPASSSMFPAAAQPGGFSTLIPSVQKMINVAQTVTPMVRQYYPLVKQLPALWSMLSSTNQTSEDSNSTSTMNESMDDLNDSEKPFSEETAEDTAYFSEAPPPKLYI